MREIEKTPEKELSLKQELYQSLTKDPEDWRFTKYRAIHTPTKVSWWTANGLLGFRVDNASMLSIGLYYHIKLWFWLKKCQSILIKNSLKKQDEGI